MNARGLSSLLAELEPVPKRWTRAARAALITAVGGGVMAAMRITNPLGLTLLVNFAQPEAVFPLTRGAGFLFAAAIFQFLGLFVTAALVESPVANLAAFIIICLVSTYLIYAVPTLGRLWIWIQVPVVTAFYMVMYEPGALGWDNAGMFAGLAIAVALLWLFNNLIWPEPPEMVLADSLAATLQRSRRRLALLIDIFLGRASFDDDRPVASRLGYHISLLGAAHGADVPRRSATLLAYVLVAERVHNEIERIATVVKSDDMTAEPYAAELAALALRLDQRLSYHVQGLPVHITALQSEDVETPSITVPDPNLKTALATFSSAASTWRAIADPMERICQLLEFDPLEVPSTSERPAAIEHASIAPNHFLMRFSARHTVALTASFLIGLWDNNVALHAALWLLMLGGPPSHGATARKFTMRAVGSSGALILAALGTIIVAPNYTSPGPYMTAIFAGVIVMAYIGEGGGILSYLAIGGTAFVIAYGGPGPRPDVIGSIWSVWGISLGMIIRAVVSLMWREHASRTLAEQFQGPLAAVLALIGDQEFPDQARRTAAESATVKGITAMLSIANDAQLEGHGAGIDASNLVDALDTMRRVAFLVGNMGRLREDGSTPPMALANLRKTLRMRFETWLAFLRLRTDSVVGNAPLREMVMESINFQPSSSETEPSVIEDEASELADITGQRDRLIELIETLERQLTTISLN